MSQRRIIMTDTIIAISSRSRDGSCSQPSMAREPEHLDLDAEDLQELIN